jgi:hypothetical protein
MPKPLTYRPPYSGATVAPWVKTLSGRSGAYVIRDRASRRVLYVGESHTGRLRKTLLRHFQRWKGQTAGKTYRPGSVEVAIRICPPPAAVAAQDNLIARLRPRDNEIRSRDPDPF